MNKLKIVSFEDEKYGKRLGEMDLDFNPTTLTHGHQIEFHDDGPPNTAAPESKYKKTGPESLSFDILFDGTGVADGSKVSVNARIEQFKKLAYYYNGSSHEIPYVIIIWGAFINFKGRIKSLEIKHTHFDFKTAQPIRSKLTVSFTKSIDSETETKERGQNSPDLTHVRTVKAGDILPLMCQDIYGDSKMYLQVAKINGLTDFRNLKLGSEISFPPLK